MRFWRRTAGRFRAQLAARPSLPPGRGPPGPLSRTGHHQGGAEGQLLVLVEEVVGVAVEHHAAHLRRAGGVCGVGGWWAVGRGVGDEDRDAAAWKGQGQPVGSARATSGGPAGMWRQPCEPHRSALTGCSGNTSSGQVLVTSSGSNS